MYHYHVDFTCGNIKLFAKVSIKRKILVSTYEVCMMEIQQQIKISLKSNEIVIIHSFQLLEHN
ncbi:hypothetical protein [Nostoc phage YongM]|nr:hypothetical protein [Nostoc phage YongM]